MIDDSELSVSWDPLEVATGSDHEILTAAKKREIKNILKSYVGTYDPFSEIIQNAMDAVEKRQTKKEKDFVPKITVVVDLKQNSLQIIDNGCGFTKDQFKSFIAPNISFKKDTTSRGNKGVGATYIAYGFNHLEIKTKNESFAFSRLFTQGREWVEDNSGTIHRPNMEFVPLKDTYFDDLDQGTSVKIIFGGKNTRPSDLSWYQATTPEQWLYLLLIKTPLGHINLPDASQSDILFDIIVIDQGGSISKIENQHAKYKYPHLEIKASQKLSDVINSQTIAITSGKDPSKSIEKYKNSNGIYDMYTQSDLLSMKNLNENEKSIVKNYNVTGYGYYAYSTSIWDQLNDVKAKLRKNYRVLKGGLQIANNGMVQGEMITIPLTKSIGHQNQTHVIVHFNGADPDLGRKGFQPELKALAEKIAVYIVGKLSSRRDLLKGDSGEKPDIEKEIKVHDWIKNQEEHEKSFPLVLQNENFFLPTKKISINSVPVSEQDVIVLFNQLLAGGVIRGVRLLSTSQIAQYDGIFKYFAEKPFDNLFFDKNKNPLGVYEEQLKSEYIGPPKILEYKFSLDGLIREFESGIKNEKDVSLAIFWEFGEEYKRDYTVTSLLDFNNIQHRDHHGITHVVRSANSKFSAICLSELIDLLNDPDGQQTVQQARYGDEV